MEQQRDHGSEGQRENPPLAACRWRAISTILVIGFIIVLSDLSCLERGMARDLPDRGDHGARVSESGKIEFAADEDLGQVKDSAPDEKEIERAYLELLTKKKKKVEDTTILRAGEDGFYRVFLVNGRRLRAVTVEVDKESVTVTDSKGIVISLRRVEIAGIEKIEGEDAGRREE
jgi:hypothetical protein